MSIYRTSLFGWDLLMCKVFGKRKPLIVQFEVTSRCNSNCKYCGFEGKKKEFKTEEALSLLEQLSDLGTRKIIFTGGEPLLRDDIGRLLSKSKELGMEVNVNTNGILLPENIDCLENVDLLNLSLDGPRDTHNNLRGNNSFDKVMRAARMTQSRDVKVCFTTVICEKNKDEVDWLINKSEAMDIPIGFQPVVGRPYGSEEAGGLELSDKSLEEFILKLKRHKKNNKALVRPSIKTIDMLGSLFGAHKKINCPRGIIAFRIEGKKVTPCARAKKSEKVEIEGNFREAFNKITLPVACNRECCTGDIELSNIWNIEATSIKNQLRNRSF